jgi:crotonobetainyl-CoA:carnitine CoA-transferase CaiB-like acyl-CoA transferase
MPSLSQPLAGVRVLEFSHFLAGPYAGLVLQDLGADVVKVEDPGRPDEARSMGPHFLRDQSLYFLSLNWGKRSLGVRLGNAGARAVLHDLVAEADVVLENYRPGAMARHGLGADTLCELNPRLVYCSLTGFGSDGPYADRPGYDYTIQALAGVMSLAGDPEGPPTKAGISYVDHVGGLAAALGVTSALAGRERSGTGGYIDLSLLDVQVSMLTYLATWRMNAPFRPERLADSAHPSIVPAQNFRTLDGYLSLFVGNDWMWARLVEEVEDDDLRRPDYVTLAGRAWHRKAVVDRLAVIFATDTAAHWARRLEAAGVACAPVNDLGGALDDPQVKARSLLAHSDHPDYGGYWHVRGPIPTLAADPAEGAPVLGQHTYAVLEDVGYSRARIDEFVTRGVLCTPDPG